MKQFLFLLVLGALLASCSQQPAVLIFSKTKGYRHESIDSGKIALMKLGTTAGYRVDTTESAEAFTEDNLKKYRAVIFLSTTSDVLNTAQQADFMRFIQAGGGYLGIHAAADTEYDWWWYGKLVGAYFKSHPEQQEATMSRVNTFPGDTEGKLQATWKRKDEWYNYKKISPDIKVLYNLEETSYKGGENGNDHPIMWYHDFDGGRSFYIGFGHTRESYRDPSFMDAVSIGLKYAVGEKALDYSKAYAKRVPEENRFSKVVLKYFLDEPTEMTILPSGRIMFIERKGNVKLYDPATDSLAVINTFNVWTKSEDGMIGLARDPNFEKNHWIYVFYSHPERSVNVLSRFEFKDGKLDMASEKQILDVKVQRETCCHTGGSLVFDPDGNLFISTGDNTNPFESDGYSPADGRPGRDPFDALSSSSNTNDLRGKILRIHPEPDGTYTIPEGNLFPKGEDKTRPEIYVMGLRNPYRISFDSRRKYLYWGEVGPDAGNDSPVRGPRGYDEVNLAKGPGYFGWPLFIGNNYGYAQYDFATKEVSPAPDPKAPKNLSPHNTGKQDLPPLSPPFIYYPYDISPDFPLMETGGRNAMAGPVYYADQFAGKPGAFPDWLDGKLIIYEWMRGWIRLVSLREDGSIQDIEPFMESTVFNNPMDMEFGPDGKLYMLEYGTKWFGHNEDARLVRIDWNPGNRPPSASLEVDKKSGALPLTVSFDATASADPDGGKLKYSLDLNGTVLTSEDGRFSHTITTAGVYRPKLTVTDPDGTTATQETVIIAGNASPQISFTISGNETYYFAGKSAGYGITVTDSEDGATTDGKITADAVSVSLDFMEDGYDQTMVAQGHQKPNHPGQLLISESDCKSCHQIDQKSAGPAYREIAKKYKGESGAIDRLAGKVIKGGSGVWGDVAMAAHPQIKPEDAAQMVNWILSLAEEKKSSLGLTGTIKFDKKPSNPAKFRSAWVLQASYADRGQGNLPSLTVSSARALRAPYLTAADEPEVVGGGTQAMPQGGKVFTNLKEGSSITFRQVDLTSVSSLALNVVEIGQLKHASGSADILLGGKDGKKIGTVNLATVPGMAVQAGIFMKSAKTSFPELKGKTDITFVFHHPKGNTQEGLFYLINAELDSR